MKNPLNPYQKNSLRISLLMFEENLRRAQEWLDGREENGILYRRKLEISEENRKQATRAIVAALKIIEKVSRTFALEVELESASAILRGALTVNWENLMDTKAAKLKRYGKVHPELGGMLDEDIQELAEIALKLSAILGETQQEKP
jgi:hypothetical protein